MTIHVRLITGRWLARLGAAVLVGAALSACQRQPQDRPQQERQRTIASPAPDHLLVLVFDQMRPDYIDRFQLPHFQDLRDSSRHYADAYVGHLGSQTVVSHLVIPTGLLPKDLPWQDDVLVDREGVLGRPNGAYDVGALKRQQFWTLLAPLAPGVFLPQRVRAKTGLPVFTAGEK